MKELLHRLAPWLLSISFVVLIVADLRWLLLSSRETRPVAPVRHAWTVAVMRHRIHTGMLDTQVARILGRADYIQSSTLPGDIPDTPNVCEKYVGRDGPLFVYYKNTVRGEVVVDTDTKWLSINGTGT